MYFAKANGLIYCFDYNLSWFWIWGEGVWSEMTFMIILDKICHRHISSVYFFMSLIGDSVVHIWGGRKMLGVARRICLPCVEKKAIGDIHIHRRS